MDFKLHECQNHPMIQILQRNHLCHMISKNLMGLEPKMLKYLCDQVKIGIHNQLQLFTTKENDNFLDQNFDAEDNLVAIGMWDQNYAFVPSRWPSTFFKKLAETLQFYSEGESSEHNLGQELLNQSIIDDPTFCLTAQVIYTYNALWEAAPELHPLGNTSMSPRTIIDTFFEDYISLLSQLANVQYTPFTEDMVMETSIPPTTQAHLPLTDTPIDSEPFPDEDINYNHVNTAPSALTIAHEKKRLCSGEPVPRIPPTTVPPAAPLAPPLNPKPNTDTTSAAPALTTAPSVPPCATILAPNPAPNYDVSFPPLNPTTVQQEDMSETISLTTSFSQMSYAETASVTRPPLITIQHNGQEIITIDKAQIDDNKFMHHFNKTFPLQKIPFVAQDIFMHALDSWLGEHKAERELLVTGIQASTSRCNFLKKTVTTNKINGITGTVNEDTFQLTQHNQLMISNLSPNDIHDPEHLNVVLAEVAIILRTQHHVAISPEECRALALAQPIMVAHGHSAVIIDITPRLLNQVSYVVQAITKTRSTPNGGQHKNFYVITFLNNINLHNIVPFAASRGHTLEDSSFTSFQILHTIRQLLSLPDSDIAAFIQPVYQPCTVEGEKGDLTTLFYTVLFYQQHNTTYNINNIHESCSLNANKPVNITINDERMFQMGKTIEGLVHHPIPRNALNTQKALRITGLQPHATPHDIRGCIDSSVLADVDTIQVVAPHTAYVLLKTGCLRTSFANAQLKKYKLPSVTLNIQPCHFGRAPYNKNYNPFNVIDSHTTPTAKDLSSEWKIAAKKNNHRANGKKNM
jgi:hypothetical protein